MIDPYLFAIGIIGLVLIMGAILVKRLYDKRTSAPWQGSGSIVDYLIPKPPQ